MRESEAQTIAHSHRDTGTRAMICSLWHFLGFKLYPRAGGSIEDPARKRLAVWRHGREPVGGVDKGRYWRGGGGTREEEEGAQGKREDMCREPHDAMPHRWR